MKYTSDYKKAALDALRGNWPAALTVSFISGLLFDEPVNTVDIEFTKEVDLEHYLKTFQFSEIWPVLEVFLIVFAAIFLVLIIASIAIGGAIRMGHCIFNLNLIDGNNARIKDIFSQLPRFVDGFFMQLLTVLYIFLWSLLFIIPGIIKIYAYRMTPYILAENPGMKPSQAIEKSKSMMQGHKMDLFCLEISFIGWSLLASIPSAVVASIITNSIIGTPNPLALVMIVPLIILSFAAGVALYTYTSAAEAAFYRNLAPLYSNPVSQRFFDHTTQ